MANFSEDESDPEMAEDLEKDVSEQEELFESEKREVNATSMDPAKDAALLNLEVGPVSMKVDPYDHFTVPSLSKLQLLRKFAACAFKICLYE